ncbi:MAG: DNA-binding response regulator [Alphaproteobacteria bacterium]|nr:MAG: DNA-binding response regulator [Alphaproteobacteria bacterium]
MRALIVEDHPVLAAQLKAAVADAGFVADCASGGEEALFLGETEAYDVVILDLGLPEVDGLSILTRWRATGRAMPVLILTARDGWSDKVAGLNAGADDYLTKPFNLPELIARLRALVRRAHGHAQPVITLGAVGIDTTTQQVTLAGAPVRLTALEYRLLAYLALRSGAVVSKTELTEHLYAQDFDRDSNTLEVIIARLRKKLGEGRIETLRGQGYRLSR